MGMRVGVGGWGCGGWGVAWWWGAHIRGCSWWPGGGSWFHGSRYCPLGLSLWHRPFWWGVHGLPQLSVETSVLGSLSSLSPGYGQFYRHTAQGIPDTGFHVWHHIFLDQVSCLWGGQGWSTGCWRVLIAATNRGGRSWVYMALLAQTVTHVRITWTW